jgi:Helix-turn-helix domain
MTWDSGGITPFLIVEDVAARLRCSVRRVHELTRCRAIPHRRLAGSRRCLFRMDELEAWEDGAPLETVELPGGGRIVRPIRRGQRAR